LKVGNYQELHFTNFKKCNSLSGIYSVLGELPRNESRKERLKEFCDTLKRSI
jgi:hypothetical protein